MSMFLINGSLCTARLNVNVYLGQPINSIRIRSKRRHELSIRTPGVVVHYRDVRTTPTSLTFQLVGTVWTQVPTQPIDDLL